MKEGKVAIIGAGSWGTALGTVLHTNGFDVFIWTIDEEQVKEIEDTGYNKKYLPETLLSKDIIFTTNFKEAVEGAKIVITAVPSAVTKKVVNDHKDLFNNEQIIVNVSKGFAPSGERLSVAIKESLPNNKVVILSGPSHAEEVAQKKATVLVATSEDLSCAEYIQMIFSNPYFRVYTNTDVIGVEIGGALKNVIALIAGAIDGIGLGDNTKAALMTRGMSEIAKFGVSQGAKLETFYGLTGMGDLIVTCGSVHSRNRRAGMLLGQGRELEDVLKEVGMVVEGLEALKIMKSIKVESSLTPIINELYAVLFTDKTPKEALSELMSREYKREIDFL
ncbi:MAG: NAD(P)H-dependent glycerol-3-phosphate dehydrogenase [Lachnospirales bacterium]